MPAVAAAPTRLARTSSRGAAAGRDNTENTKMDETQWLKRQLHELQGSMLAMECFVNSLTEALTSDARVVVQAFYASESAAFRAALMSSTAPEETVAAFERDVQRALNLLGDPPAPATDA